MSASQLTFATAYKQLNSDQKLAVDTIDGPVMVLAGPGTGKTQVLSLRIARILEKTDTPPSSILALTFTDAAAAEMRSRLISLIGTAGYGVPITTFHAFCTALIKENPEYFPIAKESEPVTELERSDILHRLFETLPLEVLKPLNQPMLYVPSAMKAISDLKREGVTPDRFGEILDESFAPDLEPTTKAGKILFARNKAKNQELLKVFAAYEDALREKLRFDFEDMILFVLRAFAEYPDFLSICQERFLYLLVDEYQDTNTAQNTLVEQLASYWGAEANVFVVGDPHQAIYRFQGASLENTYRFMELYPAAELIALKTGYRCPQVLYDAAFSLTKHTSLPESLPAHLREGLSTQLSAVSSESGGVKVVEVESQNLEHAYLVKELRALLAKGVSSEEIVVLCRTNREVYAAAEVLLAQGVMCTVSGGTSVLEKTHIRGVLAFLQTVLELRSGGAGHELFTVLSSPWFAISRVALWRVARQASKEGITLFEFLSKEVSSEELEPILAVLSTVQELGITERQSSFPDWFTQILTQIGYLPWLLRQPEKFTFLAEIQALSETVKRLSYTDHTFGLKDFVRATEIMQERNIRLDAKYLQTESTGVEITTAHKAKGREWEYVFLLHSIDGVWGNGRKSQLLQLPDAVLRFADLNEKDERLAEDRRLFYVALTRAKKQFIASYSQTLVQAGKEKTALPTQFLAELDMSSIATVSEALSDEEQGAFLEYSLRPIASSSYSPTEKEYFASLLSDFRLSVTALNKYLRDPEVFVQDVLLRLPQAKPAPMAFGSAVHKALEFIFREVSESGSQPSLQAAQQVFVTSLQQELLSTDELERRITYGENMLAVYYQDPSRFAAEPVFIERFFGSGFSTTMLGDIALSGRIDRVDWIDKEKKLVRVVDYKTGKQRSVKDIEGQTQSSELSERELALPESIRGPYKRQLLFYKLLADLDPSFKPSVTEGVFEFVEPHRETGKIVSRSFELSPVAVDELAELIKTVMLEIRSLQFLQ
ncbi:MAG: ATP-dependent DNA helicase [bacterium]|nr:ATP-dependent DNA helicase [bacterium]